jgi:hypothetical protein
VACRGSGHGEADFEKSIKYITEIDIENYKLYRNKLAVFNNKEIIVVCYDINDRTGFLQLSFTKTGNKFELEKLSYKRKQ